MKRFLLLIWIVFFFYTGFMPAPSPILTLGGSGNASTFAEFFATLDPETAPDEIIIMLHPNYRNTEETIIVFPEKLTGKKITLDAKTPAEFPKIEQLYANGIPLTIRKNVALPNAWIFGGGLAENGKTRFIESSNITMDGKAAYLFGGGGAYHGGRSFVKNTATISIGENAVIYQEIFGCGLADGTQSYSECADTAITFAGTSDYLLGGGSAQSGGMVAVKNGSSITVAQTGLIHVALFGGGSAKGEKSSCQSANAMIIIRGQAGWVFGGDFAYQGGQTRFTGLATITTSGNQEIKELYGGSFATDPGSIAYMNQFQITATENVGKIIHGGAASNEGQSEINSESSKQ